MLFEVETDQAHKLSPNQPSRPERTRPVFIATDWFDEIVRMTAEYVDDHMAVVVVDDDVAQLYPERLDLIYNKLPRVRTLKIKGGERAKTLRMFTRLQEFLLENEFNRDDILISIGGGTISDLVGFVACTFSRGVSWISIPTTFIAQFDCAIGGKNAVNLENHKNYCGTFYWPNVSFVDTSFLGTLPDRFYRAGVSELARLAMCGNAAMFEELSAATRDNGLAGIKANVEKFILDAIQVKLGISVSDPFQMSKRMALLAGHTTAHALESASKMHLHHGEAVSIGLAFESFIASEMEILDQADRKKLVDILEDCQLPTVLPAELHDRLLVEHMRLEKRNRGRMVSLVLPYTPGRMVEDWPAARVLMTPDELWSKLVAYRLQCG